MSRALGGTDAAGYWQWKDAYEVLEIAQVKFLQKFGPALVRMSPPTALTMLEKIQHLCPTHTKRTDESVKLQQFSTPLPVGYAAMVAAGIQPQDCVLEPSAGTGMLAVLGEMSGASLILNELADDRAALLGELFKGTSVSRHNAEYLNDYIEPQYQPTVVLMNPPFSQSPNALKARSSVTMEHIAAALKCLPAGGRLVAITGEGFSPYASKWRGAFVKLQQQATLKLTTGISGKLYRKQGTTVDTRLTVIDHTPAPQSDVFPASLPLADSAQELLQQVTNYVPPRFDAKPTMVHTISLAASSAPQPDIIELGYDGIDWVSNNTADANTESLYEAYETQSISIKDACPHPSPLVQSAAMASVASPKPSYKPHLYGKLVTEGVLSDAQLESIIYAGEAHSKLLSGNFRIGDTLDQVTSVAPDDTDAVQFRRGWYLGDGTGCGKGRQVAGIILDNWLKGRRRAVWVSKSDKLLEDARRDWAALGGNELDVLPQWKFKLGQDINLAEGILFTTYSTLRMAARQGKASRLEQLVEWLGDDFDGCIMFDEAHAMANAASSKGSRGIKKASQQGLAGIRLQNALPLARVVYVSATGATTVNNLAYAGRLGLWGTMDMPFATQAEFVAEMERGGIAAMEMISRDLKAMGLYLARSLSYEGVQYAFLEHQLTPEQIRIYDAYAEAFQIIHHNLEESLKATNISNADGKARNGMAKAAVRSAFESNKQRFFNHLLVAMKCPTLLKEIEADLERGHAPVIQVVSTNEALLERRLAKIPTSEWGDLNIDITPREYVLDYLMNGFPVQLHEVFVDEDGNESTRPATDANGNPVQSREALKRRDHMVEALACLPPVPGALDQLIQHFGHEKVAEVTGRSRRIIRLQHDDRDRLVVQNRPASANLAEAQSFMNDDKQILIFSDAGGTGRSYHADRGAKNQRLRIHYLLEAGWKADAAIQGLGRTNRTNQAQAPIFRPVATDVQGEKRFLSTIARRLDTLGAITRGQRQTGGQGLFREEDNLESSYAKAALTELYHAIIAGKLAACSLRDFENTTGLSLQDEYGATRQDLPPISQFLNRVLALPIHLQNQIFEAFTLRINSRIEQAKEAGIYDMGMETLTAEKFTVLEMQVLYEHPENAAKTLCYKIERTDRTNILALSDAMNMLELHADAVMVKNKRSGRVAICLPTNSTIDHSGELIKRLALYRPLTTTKTSVSDFNDSGWMPIHKSEFVDLWQAEASAAPTFKTSIFYLVTGVLLPVWRHLSADTNTETTNVQVCRLEAQMADGSMQRLLGRLVNVTDIEAVFNRFGIAASAPVLLPNEIVYAVMRQRQCHSLNNGLALRYTTIMGNKRLEVTGFREGQREQLKALGCLSEIISYQLRLFIPFSNDNENHTAAIVQQLQQLL